MAQPTLPRSNPLPLTPIMYSHSPNQSTTSLSDIDDDDLDVNKSAFFTDHALVVSPARWSSRFGTLRPRIRTLTHSPMSHLPPEVLIHILKHLHTTRDLHNALLVCRAWCECTVELLWHKPCVSKLATFTKMINVLARDDQTFAYHHFVRRLNFLFLGAEITDSLFSHLAVCDRLERLTLVGCAQLSDDALARVLPCCKNLVAIDLSGVANTSDRAIVGLAASAKRLQGINLGGCKSVTNDGVMALATHCPLLRRVKLSGVEHVTDESVSALARLCPLLLEIDLNKCKQITDVAVRDIWTYSTHMRELRLANCNLTDAAFPSPPRHDGSQRHHQSASFPISPSRSTDSLPPLVLTRSLDHLRMLDLTACGALTDDAIEGIVSYAPKIRNLVLSKCVMLTDRSVESICRLGRYLHYLHLGHAASITDRSVPILARCCTRIRYIDFANCTNLTDLSVFELSSLPKLRRIGLVRVSNLTDEAVYALGDRHSTLERIHLSYCDQISVMAIHFLLQKLHKLTHLSLTGIPAFRRPELQKFCRAPPTDFNMSQRAAFCVYSGKGVSNLRAYLTELFDSMAEEMNTTDDTEYDDDEGERFHEDVADVEMETGDDEEFPSRTYIPPAAITSHQATAAAAGAVPTNYPTGSLAGRSDSSPSFIIIDQPMEPALPVNVNSSASSRVGFLSAARARGGFGQQLLVERTDSPPPSDVASNRSAQSSNGGFFRTYQETTTRSNGARTPDLNFAELGHGRGSGYVGSAAQAPPPPSRPAVESSSSVVSFDPIAGPSRQVLAQTVVNALNQPRGGVQQQQQQQYGDGFGQNLHAGAWPYMHRETETPSPMLTEGEPPHGSSVPSLLDKTSSSTSTEREREGGEGGRGRSVKRTLRNPFAFASAFSFGRQSSSHDGFFGGGKK